MIIPCGKGRGGVVNISKTGLFAIVLLVTTQLQTCSAGTSSATKLLSGIWTEEGCIVPAEEKGRKIWGIATVWLLDDPIDPCNSPCGCPPEGLNPPFKLKPSGTAGYPVANIGKFPSRLNSGIGQILQVPQLGLPPLAGSGVPPVACPNSTKELYVQGGLYGPGGLYGIGGLYGPGGPFGIGGIFGAGGSLGPRLPVELLGGLYATPGFGVHNEGLLYEPGGVYGVGGLYGPGGIFGLGGQCGYGGAYGLGGLYGPGGPFGPRIPPNVLGRLNGTVPSFPPFIGTLPPISPPHLGPPSQFPPQFIGRPPLGPPPIFGPPPQPIYPPFVVGPPLQPPPPVHPPFFGPPLQHPPPVHPPFIGPPVHSIAAPPPVHPPFIGRIPLHPIAVPSITGPIIKPNIIKVPIDFGHVQVPFTPIATPITTSVGTSSITDEDHDKTHFNVNYDSDKGSKNTSTSTTGSIAAGLPLVVSPPQVGISTGSTTVTQEDWDKEKFNANYDKDKGNKQTVTTTGGSPALIAAPPCQTGSPQVVGTAGTTTVTQEDWDKEKFNANYDKDKGSKQTTTTTGGTIGVPGQTIVVPPQAATAASTTVTQEDWDKEKLSANYDKDKGSKQTVTTTGGTTGAPVAAPLSEPCLCTPGTHPVYGGQAGTTTVTQDDWDKQHLNLNYNKDQGSRTNVTTAGLGFVGSGISENPYRPPPFYGPFGPQPVLGPMSNVPPHIDVGVMMPPVPFPPGGPGSWGVILPPLPHPPFQGFPPLLGPQPVPFLPPQGLLPTPPHIPGHSVGSFVPPTPIIPPGGFPPQPQPTPPHHGLHSHFPSVISKLPIVGPLLKPVLEHVIIDLGDNQGSTVPLDIPNRPHNIPPPPTLGPDSSMPPTTGVSQQPIPPAPGRLPSLISKIPIVGPLLQPYFEPATISAGDSQALVPVPVQAGGTPVQRPIGIIFHTVPIHLGTGPLPQQINPEIPVAAGLPPPPCANGTLPAVFPNIPGTTGPISLPPPPSSAHSVLPAGIPHDVPSLRPPQLPVGTLPAQVPPSLLPGYPQRPLHHNVPIDFGHYPPLQNLPPQPSFGPVSNGPTPSVSGNPSGPLFHNVPIDFGHYPPLQNLPHPPSFGPTPSVSGHPSGPLFHNVPIDFGHYPPLQNLPHPPSLGPTPSISGNPSGSLFHNVPVDFGHGPPVQNLGLPPSLSVVPPNVYTTGSLGPPPSIGPVPQAPPPILGPKPEAPPPNLDFLPKDPAHIFRPAPIQDPGLLVSHRNRYVLVNRYGGGVVLPQPYKCTSGTGRCGNSREIKYKNNMALIKVRPLGNDFDSQEEEDDSMEDDREPNFVDEESSPTST